MSWDTTAVADGLYDLRVITTDNVGNTFTSAPVANVRVDNTAPTGSITAPAANAFVNGASVAVSANSADAGSGVSSAQFQTSPHGASIWTNLGAADATSPYGVTWNTTTYADGQYDLRVITTDKSGNTFTLRRGDGRGAERRSHRDSSAIARQRRHCRQGRAG